MKLYWGPHTCAIGIHVLLEELGARYETERIDVADGATHAPPFIGVNPKGKVPTLVRDDGTVLTEFSAIATWLARTHPEHGLLPADPEVEARIIRWAEPQRGALPVNISAHLARMLARPAVRKVRRLWGEDSRYRPEGR